MFQACIFVSIIWLVNWTITTSNEKMESIRNTLHPKANHITHIPDCSEDMYLKRDIKCYTLLYSPKHDLDVSNIINNLSNNNDPPISKDKIKGFHNMSETDTFLLNNPQSTLAAVHFFKENDKRISYVIQTNTSIQYFKGKYKDPNFYIQLPLQSAIERELIKYMTNDDDLNWSVSFTPFSHPEIYFDSLIASIIPVFILASCIINYAILLEQMVKEKETGIIQGMTNMGLQSSSYWCSCFSSELIICIIHTMLLSITSYILNISLFTNNSITLIMVLVLLFNVSMMSFAFLTSVFINCTNHAIPMGLIIFIIAWIMHMCIQSGFPYLSYFSNYTRVIFNMFPWSLMSKAFGDLAQASWFHDKGIYWSDIDNYCVNNDHSSDVSFKKITLTPTRDENFILNNCVISIKMIMKYFVIQIISYFTCAIYIQNIISNSANLCYGYGYGYSSSSSNNKRRKLPKLFSYLYTFSNYYQNKKSTSNVCVTNYLACNRLLFQALNDHNNSSNTILETIVDDFIIDNENNHEDEDEDVKMEKEKLKKSCQSILLKNEINENPVIKIFNLKKNFNKKVPVIKGLWLGINEGECFCLLGPNGAGKTTTINCLTGMLRADSGDALIYGQSISTSHGLNQIRSMMGVCPQFDILYNYLTAQEHLNLYIKIKNKQKQKYIFNDHKYELENDYYLLEKVKLNEVRNKLVETFSGGMKRRLSVAIAFIGNPRIVYLDEPTTGMDPISRRYVWDMIDEAKRKRVVILTTHSMEEADILGDRIGIMTRGELRCIGSGLRLKRKFGSGFKLSISIKEKKNTNEKYSKLKDIMSSIMKIDIKCEETDSYIHFLIPKDYENEIKNIINVLKNKKNNFVVQDIQISLTPLEEVFLKVTQQAELEYSRLMGQYEQITIPEENMTIKVLYIKLNVF